MRHATQSKTRIMAQPGPFTGQESKLSQAMQKIHRQNPAHPDTGVPHTLYASQMRSWNMNSLSGEIGLLEHLWGRSPFSVRRGAEVAQRADRGDTHTQTRKDFTQLRAARMRKTLLLPVWIDSSSCSGAQEATVSLELGRG